MTTASQAETIVNYAAKWPGIITSLGTFEKGA